MRSHGVNRTRWLRTWTSALAAGALVIGATMGAGAAAFGAAPAKAASSAAANSDTKMLRIATSGFVDNFNPFTSIYLTPTNIIRYMYENLVQDDQKDGSPTKGLAGSWTTSSNGKQWTYTLQNNLKWSDGQPITSKDVKYTFDQMLSNPTLATANGSLTTNFESVAAPNSKTVVINLKSAQAANPGSEIPIVPEHIWSKIKDPAKYANEKNVVGSGPYTLKSYSANQSITLKSNPNFWMGGPKIEGIQYIYYTNSDAEVQALRSGDVDFVTSLSPEQAKALKGNSNITVHSGAGRRYESISINSGLKTPQGVAYGTGSSALHDVQVRQALRLGIDSKSLLKHVLNGQGTVATSFIPIAFKDWYLPTTDSAIVKYDPAAAKQKLEDAGWKVGADGIRVKDGQQLTLRLLVDASDSTEQTMSQYLAPWMKAIGVKLNVESTDSDTISSRSMAGDYDLYFSGWSVNPDPDYQLGINTCASLPDAEGNNGTTQDGYCSAEFDKLFNQERAELNHSKRVALVHKMLSLNYTDTAQISLWYANSLEAYRSDRFTGFGLQPEKDGIIANQAGYWGFLNVKPVAGSSAASSASAAPYWIGGGVLAVIIIGGVIFFVRRSRRSDDRE